jgi:hypothetical protein
MRLKLFTSFYFSLCLLLPRPPSLVLERFSCQEEFFHTTEQSILLPPYRINVLKKEHKYK